MTHHPHAITRGRREIRVGRAGGAEPGRRLTQIGPDAADQVGELDQPDEHLSLHRPDRRGPALSDIQPGRTRYAASVMPARSAAAASTARSPADSFSSKRCSRRSSPRVRYRTPTLAEVLGTGHQTYPAPAEGGQFQHMSGPRSVQTFIRTFGYLAFQRCCTLPTCANIAADGAGQHYCGAEISAETTWHHYSDISADRIGRPGPVIRPGRKRNAKPAGQLPCRSSATLALSGPGPGAGERHLTYGCGLSRFIPLD
jgi:hypothetical protein